RDSRVPGEHREDAAAAGPHATRGDAWRGTRMTIETETRDLRDEIDAMFATGSTPTSPTMPPTVRRRACARSVSVAIVIAAVGGALWLRDTPTHRGVEISTFPDTAPTAPQPAPDQIIAVTDRGAIATLEPAGHVQRELVPAPAQAQDR